MYDRRSQAPAAVRPGHLQNLHRSLDAALSLSLPWGVVNASLLMVQCEIRADAVELPIAMAAERGVPVLFDPAPAGRVRRHWLSILSCITPNLVKFGGTQESVR